MLTFKYLKIKNVSIFKFESIILENKLSFNPSELCKTSKKNANNFLFFRSKKNYEFEKCCKKYKVQEISENVLIAYFEM